MYLRRQWSCFRVIILVIFVYFGYQVVDYLLTAIFTGGDDEIFFRTCPSTFQGGAEKILKDKDQFAEEDNRKNPTRQLIQSYRISGLAKRIVKWLTKPVDVPCRSLERFGTQEPGGHDGHWVCMDVVRTGPSASQNAPKCLVYSFGVGYDFSFEDQIIVRGCEVHSFDPSMNFMDHMRGAGVYFHRLGLREFDQDDYVPLLDGGFVREAQMWRVRTLDAIMKELGHSNRSISVLKMDIEGAEWPVMEYLLLKQPHLLSNSIDQLIIEWHVSDRQFSQIDGIAAVAGLFRRCSGFYLVYADYWRRDSGFHAFLTTYVNSKLISASDATFYTSY